MRFVAVCLFLLVGFMSCDAAKNDIRNFLEILAEFSHLTDKDSAETYFHERKFPHHSQAQNIKKILCAVNGKVHCSANCLHGKRTFPDGCCQCLCRKNYAAISSTKCRRASWSEWGRWSKCLRTRWGGLQTKERVCISHGNDAPGACVGRGSMSRKCTSVTADFRIRKNVRDLSDEELHDIVQAMTKFKKDNSKKGYRNIISWHGYPGRCPWYHEIEGHSDNHCSWHHHPLFLPWHRMIAVQLELGLQRYLENKTLGIPFWDWTEHALDIPYLIRNPEIYDPIIKKYVINPFYRTFIKWERNNTKTYTHRNIWYPSVLDDKFLREGSVRALMSHDYFLFEDRLSSNPHDQIHNCFCYKSPNQRPNGWCIYGMPTTTYASWDPTFLLHHSAIDRLFSMRRHLEESLGVSDWTRSRVAGQNMRSRQGHRRDIIESFDWPMSPFCNKSMNPESITGKDEVWTLHRSYYHEQLFGYKYTNFDSGNGYLWDDLKYDFKRHMEASDTWNDKEFETKMGKLTYKSICPHPHVETNCVISC